MRLIKQPPEIKAYDEIWRQAFFADDGIAYYHFRYYGRNPRKSHGGNISSWFLPTIHVNGADWVDIPEEEVLIMHPFGGEKGWPWWSFTIPTRHEILTYHAPDLHRQWYDIIENPLAFLIRLALSS